MPKKNAEISTLFVELVSGIEPLTCWLRINCSTNWATPANGYLGVKYTYFLMIFWDKVMLTSALLYQLSHTSIILVGGVGIEPATSSMSQKRSTNWANRPNIKFFLQSFRECLLHVKVAPRTWSHKNSRNSPCRTLAPFLIRVEFSNIQVLHQGYYIILHFFLQQIVNNILLMK